MMKKFSQNQAIHGLDLPLDEDFNMLLPEGYRKQLKNDMHADSLHLLHYVKSPLNRIDTFAFKSTTEITLLPPFFDIVLNFEVSVQKLALKVCCKGWDVHYQMLLSKSNIPSLSKRRLFLRLSFPFNIVKGSYSLPKHAPIELREYHHYSRSHNLTLKVPFAKTNTFYYSFFCDTIRHWNALPPDIIDSIDV